MIILRMRIPNGTAAKLGNSDFIVCEASAGSVESFLSNQIYRAMTLPIDVF